MKIGPGFAVVATWALISLGLIAATAPDPARIATYFPASYRTAYIDCPGEGGRIPVLDDFRINWFGSFLVAADEPSLLSASSVPSVREAYRFTWLPSFHRPLFVRLERRRAGRIWLTAKRLSGKGGYDPGSVDAHVERPLSPAEEMRFRTVLAEAADLRLPSADCHFGADGSEWIFEARDASGYRYVNRWTPDEGSIKQLGLTMLSLTGWKLDQRVN